MYHKLASSLGGALFALIFAATAALAAAEGGIALGGDHAPAFGAAVTGTVPVTPTVTATPMPRGASRIVAALAAAFNVPASEVQAVRNEQQGWGEVAKVLLLSKLSGKSPDDILALRDQKGWGQIYKSLDVKPGKKDNLGQALKNQPTPSGTLTPKPSRTPEGDDRKPTPSGTVTPRPSRTPEGDDHGKPQASLTPRPSRTPEADDRKPTPSGTVTPRPGRTPDPNDQGDNHGGNNNRGDGQNGQNKGR